MRERAGEVDAAERLHRQALAEDPAPRSTFAQEPFYLAIGGSPAARSLLALGVAALRRGAVPEACDLLLEGVGRARRDADQPAVALSMENVAAAAAGAAGYAVTLLGAAEAYRGAAMPERTRYTEVAVARTAAAARAVLDAATFRQAFDRGLGLRPEEVLAELPTAWSGRGGRAARSRAGHATNECASGTGGSLRDGVAQAGAGTAISP
jgi:hypothetical protein